MATSATTVTLTRTMPNRSCVVAKIELREETENGSSSLSPAFSLTGELFEAHGSSSGQARAKRYKLMNGNVGPAGEPDSSGCIHDEILRAFPALAKLAEMHLSDPATGEPMHAEPNAWYWLAGSREDLRAAVVASGGYTGYDSVLDWRLDERGLTRDQVGREMYCYQLACEALRVDLIDALPELDALDTIALREAEILRAQAAEIRTVDCADFQAQRAANLKAFPIEKEAREITQRAYAATYATAFARFVDAQRERWQREADEMRAYIRDLKSAEL